MNFGEIRYNFFLVSKKKKNTQLDFLAFNVSLSEVSQSSTLVSALFTVISNVCNFFLDNIMLVSSAKRKNFNLLEQLLISLK